LKILSGIDIVRNDRIKRLMERSPKVIEEMFSAAEIEYCSKKRFPEQSFGARFAVKEALMKATNSDILEFELCQIEVLNSRSGEPSVKINNIRLKNKIIKMLKKKKFIINVSLSHEKDFSIAHIIIY
jgi:holo-[acyl-carrier protein] synthase